MILVCTCVFFAYGKQNCNVFIIGFYLNLKLWNKWLSKIWSFNIRVSEENNKYFHIFGRTSEYQFVQFTFQLGFLCCYLNFLNKLDMRYRNSIHAQPLNFQPLTLQSFTFISTYVYRTMFTVQQLNVVRPLITRSFRGQGQVCLQEHPFIVAFVTSIRLSCNLLTFAFYSRLHRIDMQIVMHANRVVLRILSS